MLEQLTTRAFRCTTVIAGCFLVLLLIPRTAQSQTEERRGFIGLGIGPSAPFGSFKDASAADARVGPATPGYTSTLLNVGFRHGRRFGIAGAFSYSEYWMDDEGEDDWWQVATLTIGPMYSHRLGRKAGLDVKAMFGLIALTPVVDSYSTPDRTGSGLGFDVRATLRYDVLRRWAVFADGGLQSAAVSYGAGRRTDLRTVISGFGIAYRPMWD